MFRWTFLVLDKNILEWLRNNKPNQIASLGFVCNDCIVAYRYMVSYSIWDIKALYILIFHWIFTGGVYPIGTIMG